MPTEHFGEYKGRKGAVVNWASIIEDNTLEQALQISRGQVTSGHVAVMPDAHFGLGACVGTAIVTEGGIYPAAVGVDIGCGMIAHRTSVKGNDLDIHARRRIRNSLQTLVPSGVGTNFDLPTEYWDSFSARIGLAPSIEDGWLTSERVDYKLVAAQQFGTLGAGNHFVELSTDDEGIVWLIVHSGSRGVGNALARAHVAVAQKECKDLTDLENRDLSFLTQGTPSFDRYISDLEWAQQYAWGQREAMMAATSQALMNEMGDFEVTEEVHCHHNYTEMLESFSFLSRKGAVAAYEGRRAVLPGSMGTDTYIVEGLGLGRSYWTAPHGAGRVSSRGKPARGDKKATGAYARFTVEEFNQKMTDRGVVWQDRSALNLLDESPMVYKDINIVLSDSSELIKPIYRLEQIVNYKGV